MTPEPAAPFSTQYLYVRSRELEGTYADGPSVGTWVVTSARILRGWGAPPEEAWPYDGNAEHWPPVEPPGMDELAKRRRIRAYQRVLDANDARVCLASGKPVTVALEISASWSAAPGGVIDEPRSVQGMTAVHTIKLVGYTDDDLLFKFRNSWGASWGDGGYGYISYAHLDADLLEAWVLGIGPNTTDVRAEHGRVRDSWQITDFRNATLHGAEVYDVDADEFLAWSLAVERDGVFQVEELFVRPAFRHQGLGRELGQAMADRAERNGCDLRFWVPHADNNEPNLTGVNRIAASLTLQVRPSDVRWAAAFCVRMPTTR